MLAGRGGKNFFLCCFYFHCSKESEGDVADEFAVFMWTTFFVISFILLYQNPDDRSKRFAVEVCFPE